MTVKLGFVGTGGIAHYHLSHLAQIPDAAPVAFCDVDKSRAEKAVEQFGGNAYTDFNEMYDKETLDAVYVCLPPFAHIGQEEAAIERNLPIFVEKPIHLDIEKAKNIAAMLKDKELVSGVGFQDRYLDIIDRAKQELGERRPGLIMGYWMGGMPGVPWWRVKAESGGQIVEQTIHIFDMARNLFGEVKRVWAAGTTGLMTDVPNYDVEDASAVTLEFESGLVGTIFSACFLSTGGKSGIDIYCKDEVLKYVERTSLTIQTKDGEETIKNANDYGLEEDKAFIEAVKSGCECGVRSPYADAVKSLAVTLAANESIATGLPVEPKA